MKRRDTMLTHFIYSCYFIAEGETRYLPDGTYLR